jgi:hypothetical protein
MHYELSNILTFWELLHLRFSVHAGFLLGILFIPKDGGHIFSETLGNFHWKTLYLISEDRGLSFV